jgi:uncharacterized membrane protein YdjX (TVP38/TMEM64 family)
MKKQERNFFIFVICFAVLTIILCFLFWPFFSRLREDEYRARFSAWIARLGFKGVLILLGIQVFQIIVAAIPGGPVEVLAGAAYGGLGGLAICLTGCAIATTLIFLLVRRFGSPLVNFFFNKEKIRRYEFLTNGRKLSLAVFILFLIPGVPKDLLTYIVPLSGMSLARFIIISCFARTPAIVISTFMGASAMEGRLLFVILLFLFIAVMGIGGLLFSESILNHLRKATRGRS